MRNPWKAKAAVLPKDAREALIAAGETTSRVKRAAAVESAIQRVKEQYPQFFKQEQQA